MAYIGSSLDEVEKTVSTINVACDTMTGNGSTATLILSASQGVPESVNNISVYFDGVMQRPTNDYTLNYKTVAFTTAPETGVKVTVLSYANEFLNIVSDKTVYGSNIADGAVTAAKQTGLSFDNSDISGTMDAANLTGALPALDGSNVTGLASGQPVITNAADPTVTANPTNGVGTIWINSTTGESYCCTDATAGDNVWTNIGSGTGSIALPTNPTNAGGFVTPMLESTTYNYTFSGALDNLSTPAGTVTHYMVDNISNGALTVAAAEVAEGQPHVFTAAAVGSNTAITFRVRAKDNDGHYSSGVTVSMTVQNDAPPGEITNGGAFADINKNSSYNYTFAGATDDFGITHYLVDQISNAALTVSTAEVAEGSAHTFNAGEVGSDTAVTFRVRAKDTAGQYSAGVTVSMTVLAVVYTTATGGVVNAGTVSGNYTYHQFNSTGNFTVSQVGDDATIEYIVIAGGGDGGGASYASGAGGGGAGGYRSSVVGEQSGGGASAESKPTIQIGSYTATIGAGGAGVGNGGQNSGVASSFSGPGISTITTEGGGYGIGYGSPNGSGSRAGNGGSGGGCSWHNSAPINSGSGDGWGLGTSNEGYHGGNAVSEASAGGGGGGAGAVGQNSPADNNTAGDGGAGIASSITGASVARAGGGGGGVCHYAPYGTSASGQNPGTSSFGGGTGGSYATPQAGHGTQNTGAGGGGGQASSSAQDQGGLGQGGSGVVIVRYRSS